MLITVVGVIFINLEQFYFLQAILKGQGSSSNNCCGYEYGYLKELDALSEKGESQQVWNDEIMGYIDLYRCSFLICEII